MTGIGQPAGSQEPPGVGQNQPVFIDVAAIVRPRHDVSQPYTQSAQGSASKCIANVQVPFGFSTFVTGTRSDIVARDITDRRCETSNAHRCKVIVIAGCQERSSVYANS
ncbi:hypothetical protein CFBP4215_02625 [Pseudomonas syringae pv. syringae]|nr:hypothetical protein CFBP4215_02625 [Pseudomonas syringae pv. syringae]